MHLEFVRKDANTPKAVSRVDRGYANDSLSRRREPQTDLRQFWRVARHLGYLAINVLEEDLGVRWGVDDRPAEDRRFVERRRLGSDAWPQHVL